MIKSSQNLFLIGFRMGDSIEAKKIESFLGGFSNAKSKVLPPINNDEDISTKPLQDLAVYYGVEGKRQAVISFLSEVAANSEPQTLSLFSDEDIDWLVGDHLFLVKWMSLMSLVVLRGNRINIIHTISRNLDEMLDAISQWMPLYMSGAVNPYYYPKKRDGIFKRTLFVAPETAVVTSSSVGNMADQAVNVLIRNKKDIEAFSEEYNQYFSLCKPLMQIFTSKNAEAYISIILEFEKEKADTIIKTGSLSILTMPETIATDVLVRNKSKKKDCLIDYYRIREQDFNNNIKSNSFTEIICLPDILDVKSGKVKIAFSDMFENGAAYYSTEEYILHLENIVLMLETYENFHVFFDTYTKENGYTVYVKEDIGVLISKTSIPLIAFAMNESNMVAAFWDYMKNIISKKNYGNLNNKESVNKLREFIQQLKA